MTYRPATDLERVIKSIIEKRKQREWDPILERFREWIPRLEADTTPDAAIFRSRLASLEALVARADAIAEVFLEGGLVGRLGLKLLTHQEES